LVHHATQSIKRANKKIARRRSLETPGSAGGWQKFWVKVKNRSHPAMEREL
jgi:hypothetical protein